MNQEELDKIIELHAVWLTAEVAGGMLADLSNMDLKGLSLKNKNLSHIDFSNSDLSGVDMSHSDLSNSDLSKTDLSGSDMSYSNLSMADLSDANLTSAVLSGANLHCADMSSANLSEVKIDGANLREAEFKGTLLENGEHEHFCFRKHPAKYHGNGLLTVGCFTYHISEWMEKFREIGKSHQYSEEEIEIYGNFVKQCYKKYKKEE